MEARLSSRPLSFVIDLRLTVPPMRCSFQYPASRATTILLRGHDKFAHLSNWRGLGY